MEDRNAYQYEPLSDDDEIRIIALDPATVIDMPLSCSILHRRRSYPTTKYSAVSYAWGIPEYTGSLEIIHGRGSSLFTITTTVDTMLRYLRLPGETRYLWIDAICLNQNDQIEKAHQVPQMGSIYKRAEDVRIWLGVETARTAWLFTLFGRVDLYTYNEAYYGRSFSREANRYLYRMWKQVPGGCDKLLAFKEKEENDRFFLCDCINEIGSEFFGQSWFSRRWVIQEAMLARKAVIHWGSHTISLEVVTLYVRRMNAFQMSRVEHYRANYNKTMAAALGNPLKTTDLLEHLWNFHEAECRDKKDRIAALHGLCPYGRFQLDYKSDWKEIYKQVASSALRSANKDTRIYVLLHLFEFGAVRWPNDLDFPSWVPDWSKKRKRPLPYIMYSKYGKLEAYPSWLGLDKASLVICGDILRIHPCPAPGPTGAWRVVYVTSPSMDRYDPDHVLNILNHLIPHARARIAIRHSRSRFPYLLHPGFPT
ncbi:heterokaryon incompatibility protein-domain-containing protein [Apiospora hydei]|uniref:Heterokaryon incompatibility protein-domain-containing protein n=1 Tax=Apiospora hydei TaxID=1337664 RepID=A0ABR1V6L8_9PEZI